LHQLRHQTADATKIYPPHLLTTSIEPLRSWSTWDFLRTNRDELSKQPSLEPMYRLPLGGFLPKLMPNLDKNPMDSPAADLPNAPTEATVVVVMHPPG
jgi:hypothetical protein